MNENIREKSVLVVDNGLFISLAERLVGQFARVGYFCAWESGFPDGRELIIGSGLEGISREEYFWQCVDDYDLICYDKATEILTENGWKSFSELSTGELVATLNQETGFLEYQEPTHYIKKKYIGELLGMDSCRLNFRVTPNHNLYVRKHGKANFGLKPALECFGEWHYEFKKDCVWTGNDVPEIKIQKRVSEWESYLWSSKKKVSHSKEWPEITIKTETLMAIIGFYLAEGSLMTKGERINGFEVGQNQNRYLHEFIKILDESGICYSKNFRKSGFCVLRIHNAQLGNYFSQFGQGKTKRIPKFFKSLSGKYLKHLFDWYMKGDGCHNGWWVCTVSKSLSNDIQEVALKLGISISEKKCQGRNFKSPNGKQYTASDYYRIHFSKKYTTPTCLKSHWKKWEYDDFVYCVAVPNRVIYVRRNGVPMWCGNCFPDCWDADLQEYLRKQGRRVWGAGNKASLELSRWKTKQLIGSCGLPVNHAEQVHGLENLRIYLQKHEDVFVKVSALRGLGETFESANYEQSKGQLDELRSKYGALMDVIDFIVEDKISDAEEVGYDGYCINGEFPNTSFFGFEQKDKAYIGKVVDYDDLPEEVRSANTALSYHMDGYRQFWSTEIRNGVLIDCTARHASPGGEAFIQAMENLPEVLWHGAAGKLVHAEWSAKFAAQIILCSEWAEEHCEGLTFPDEIRPFVKIYNHCRIDGVDYCAPQIAKMKQVGSVIGLGSTVEEACDSAKERAEQVKGYDLEMETDALDKAVEEMENATVSKSEAVSSGAI